MGTYNVRIVRFLDQLMLRRKRLPSQLAADLGVSHATVRRWLQGKDIPSPKSCQRLADYSEINLEKMLSLAGHLPAKDDECAWPEKETSIT